MQSISRAHLGRHLNELWDAARERCRGDKELIQALWRLPCAAVGFGYYLIMMSAGQDTSILATEAVWAVAAGFSLCALALIASILHQPQSTCRPALSLLLDLGTFGLMLAVSGPWIAPLLLLHLLIVSTFGVRFGFGHMILAQAVGLASLAVMWLTNPAWQGHGFLALTWALSLLAMPTYVVQFLRDLADRNRQLRRSVLAGSKLLAQASHDIRHPLHASSIFTARLGATDLDPDQAQLLGSIEASLTSAGEMLQCYLDMSLVESGQLPVRSQSIPLQAIFDDLRLQCAGMAERAGVELRFVKSSQVVETDRVMLRTILQNLVTNAIRHAPGTKLVVGCRRGADGLSIQVSDRGLRAAEVAADGAGGEAPRNSGLGMSIVYGLAQQLKLEVRPLRASRGHHVRICGLLAGEEQSDFKSLYERHTPIRPLAGMKVLLVSASETKRGDEELLFRSWGCDVVAAERLDDSGRSCDLAVVHLERIDPRASALLRRLKMPAIVIAPAPAALPRRQRLTVIDARQPMNPAQIRSMMMAMR